MQSNGQGKRITFRDVRLRLIVTALPNRNAKEDDHA